MADAQVETRNEPLTDSEAPKTAEPQTKSTTSEGATAKSGRRRAKVLMEDVHETTKLGEECVKSGVRMMALVFQIVVGLLVNVFHLAYFSFRKPEEAKQMITSTVELLKKKYNENKLSLGELVRITNVGIFMPMASQNQQHYEESVSGQLKTMKTASASSN